MAHIAQAAAYRFFGVHAPFNKFNKKITGRVLKAAPSTIPEDLRPLAVLALRGDNLVAARADQPHRVQRGVVVVHVRLHAHAEPHGHLAACRTGRFCYMPTGWRKSMISLPRPSCSLLDGTRNDSALQFTFLYLSTILLPLGAPLICV